MALTGTSVGTTYTGLTSTTAVPQLVVTAYDRLFEFNLRAEPIFRMWADKRPAQVTNPGESVVFSLYNDFAPAITPLSETVAPDATALGVASQVTVTLQEYGNLAVRTKRLTKDALSNIDEGLANAIAFNCADSVDLIVQNVMRANGNQVSRRGGGSLGYVDGTGTTIGTAVAQAAITPTDNIKSDDIRTIVARMRTNKVQPRMGSLYVAGVHPMVSADLRRETGAAAWRDPHVYNEGGVGNVWDAVVGQYEGCIFLENPRCYNAQVGSGSGGTQTRVFTSYFMGQQAIAEAVNEDFHVTIGAVTDPLQRFFPLGWYGFAGWNVYRQAALYRYEVSATGQPNA